MATGDPPLVPVAPVVPPPAVGASSFVPAAAEAAAAVAEAAIPALVPFAPLISLALAYIRGHFDATGNLPTDEQVIAALPKDIQHLNDVWAAWVPSGR